MESPDYSTPSTTTKLSEPQFHSSILEQIPTISSFDNILQANDIEEFELGTQTNAVIKMMSDMISNHNSHDI